MSEMKDRIPEHSATWRARWEKMTGSLNEADEGQLEWDRNLNPLSRSSPSSGVSSSARSA